jgi:type VI secretion system protein ImpC
MLVSDTLPDLEAALGRTLDAFERACLARGLRAWLDADLPADAAADAIVASIDADLGRQLDEILHHPTFRALESAWRGLWLVVSRIEQSYVPNHSRRGGVRCELLNCSKEDLLLDFEDSPDVPKSGLYKLLYSANYGPFGGRPYAAVLADYEVVPRDLPLLRYCCAVASAAGLAFVAAASPSLASPEPLPAWRAFREHPDARFAGLLFPRVLGRAPHQVAMQHRKTSFSYVELIQRHEDHLWQNPVYALATCITRSFERLRLACDVTGPTGGGVDALPTRADREGVASTERRLSAQAEEELCARGFIPVGTEDETGRAVFRLAPTALSPSAAAPPGLAPEDVELHRQLSALLLSTRMLHYVKVIQREQIGTWKTHDELRSEFTAIFADWTRRPDAPGSDDGAPHFLSERPLRGFNLRIDDAEEKHGFRRFELRVTPDWTHQGRFFTVVIDGKLDIE